MRQLLDQSALIVLAAPANEEMPWWFPWGAAGIGVILIGTGIYQIKTRRAKAARGLTRLVMRLFGYTEMTGKLAAFNGYMNAIGGVVLLLAAPFLSQFAGILKEQPDAPVAAASPPAGPSAVAPADSSAAAPDAPARSGPVRLSETLGKSAIALPAWVVPSSTAPVQLKVRREESFRDITADGGVLVGLRVAQGTEWGGAVRAIQPIYQTGDEYRVGPWCGEPSDTLHELLAKPGFVVSRIDVRAGLVINAIQLHFSPVREGRLESQDAYSSEWIGSEGGRVAPLERDPALIVGLSGHSAGSLGALTYYTIPPITQAAADEVLAKKAAAKEILSKETKVEETPQSTSKNTQPVSRKWTSSNGRFTIDAVLVGVEGDQVVLKSADGREIKVALDRLSTEDQEFVKQWRSAQ